MSDGRPLFEKSKSIEDVQQLRLLVLLDETVRDKGIMQAAQDLNVDHRTLAASLESGKLSRRMRGALEKALLEGGGSPAREQRERNDELEGRVSRVEGQVGDLGREMNQGLTAVQGEVRELREAQERGMQRVARLEQGGDARDGEEDAESEGAAAATPAPDNTGRRSPLRQRREFPELVTPEPADDDEAVFGAACELVKEWRELKDTHPSRGKGTEWLQTEERLLSVELALLEEHGLTLPPETYPLKGLDRSSQVNWRRKALEDTQKARKRGEWLLGLRRLLTPGLWRR
ncbi:MAG: hypothetical protein OXN21_08940 [Chloroflexota bacterium]|nr:hypothetical protein [Chloroflexota bacterium]